jgi:AraC-like DNA-binding protein
MLVGGERNIGEIAIATGFSDQSYFSKVFSAKYGMPPSEYSFSRADEEIL